nr:DMT family transporter [candidate division Zixibacteria bacterium]
MIVNKLPRSIESGSFSTRFLYSTILIHQVITAIAFPVAKLGLNEIEPYTYAFLRFIISSAIYAPILFHLRKRKLIPIRDHFRIFLLGLIIIPLNQVIYLVGQSLTLASHSGLLFAMVPIFIYLLAVIFLREKPTVRRSAGIIIAFSGVYIILSGGKIEYDTNYILGDLLVLMAVVAWAAATVMAKPLALKYGAFRVTGLALLYGSVLYLPYGFYRALSFDFGHVTWMGWFSVLYMAILVSILAYFLWYWLLKNMEASRLAIMQNIQPIIAAAVAAVTLAEPISRAFVIGGIIALAGVIITEIK